ncbi:unnamed protein product [Hymenolepis diminuta]|uniref:Uncharacterized protein n=1 Tax=Hymenolepis diminuta TaxID=6216 RepID=A0A0R3SCT7_HYMDI|nr:unnamed protein product [Hymenolepis diminuta]
MSTKTTSTFLQSPTPLSPQTAQSSDQQQNAARLHSITTVRPSSTTNIFHSISSIHRSASALPVSLLDLDVASSAGLQVSIDCCKSCLVHQQIRTAHLVDAYSPDPDPDRAHTTPIQIAA